MQRLMGFTLCLILAFALACSVSESPMTALDDGNLTLAGGSGSVNGSGHFDRVDTETYRNVTLNADIIGGVAKGKITFVNHFGDVNNLGTTVTQVEVFCFAIVGNKAVLGGTITRNDIDPDSEGFDSTITVEDNGQGSKATAPDRISLGSILTPGGAQVRCDNAQFSPALFDIEQGNLTVRP